MACRSAAFAVIIIAHSFIFSVKTPPTEQVCENGDTSNIIAEDIQQLKTELFGQLNKTVQSIQEFISASFQEQVQSMIEVLNATFGQQKTQHVTAMRRLDVVTQLLLSHDISIKSETENSWTLVVGEVNKLSNIEKHICISLLLLSLSLSLLLFFLL